MHLLNEYFDQIVDLLAHYGVWAVLVLMLLESACIPAPSELIMLYAGYLVSTGDATFVEMVAAGVVGNVLGSWVAWWVGLRGGRAFIERYGKYVHMSHKHVQWADTWFERRGSATVFWARLLPIIRTFISLPAGIARMPLGRFTLYTTLGCIPWVMALCAVGVAAGPHWERVRDLLHYGDYVVVLLVLAGGTWLLLQAGRRRRLRLDEA